MATLHVRSIPDDLHARLHRLAASDNLSLSAAVVSLLEQAVAEREQQVNQRALLSGLRRRRFAPPRRAPESVQLLRESRKR